MLNKQNNMHIVLLYRNKSSKIRPGLWWHSLEQEDLQYILDWTFKGNTKLTGSLRSAVPSAFNFDRQDYKTNNKLIFKKIQTENISASHIIYIYMNIFKTHGAKVSEMVGFLSG